MLAVIKTGGKQYIATEGVELEVELLPFDEKKKTIVFEEVLLVATDTKTIVGKPVVKGAKVTATVLDQIKAKKVVIVKYQPKKRFRLKQGHRQQYLKVRIDRIEV